MVVVSTAKQNGTSVETARTAVMVVVSVNSLLACVLNVLLVECRFLIVADCTKLHVIRLNSVGRKCSHYQKCIYQAIGMYIFFDSHIRNFNKESDF